MYTVRSMVDGEPYHSSSSRTSPIFNPASGEQIGIVELAAQKDVLQAVAKAAEKQQEWGACPAAERARMMFRLYALLEEHKDELAKIISREHGKTHGDALGEVSRGIEPVAFACGIPQALKGEYSLNVAKRVDCYGLRQPLGVCVGITPFNFPVMVPLWMFANALACGNCFILKPSERDPSASLLMHDLIVRAGFPRGVFSVVQGDKEAVDALLSAEKVAGISFVGSTPIAEYVYKTGCSFAKRVQALGGAKNHMVITADADIERAADALLGSAYGAAGERCMAISIAMPIGDEVADKLVASLSQKVREIYIAPASDEKSEMGPLITKQHKAKVIGYIETGIDEGAELVVDGRDFSLKGANGAKGENANENASGNANENASGNASENASGNASGYFLGGSLFDRVAPNMRIYKEEIFGPVLCVVRAGSLEEAITLINAHELGNGVAIFTRDGASAREFVERVNIGMVGVNVPIPVPVGFHSFGGWKRSLFGAHGVYGPESVHFYTKLKTVTSRWGEKGEKGGAEFNFPDGEK